MTPTFVNREQTKIEKLVKLIKTLTSSETKIRTTEEEKT